ncbi:RNA-directed DNA polymerase, eukaryota [Tanacetum coccineum]
MDIQSLSCPMCDCGIESTDHVFVGCDVSRQLGRMISNWWNTPLVEMDTIAVWKTWFSSIRLAPNLKSIFEGLDIWKSSIPDIHKQHLILDRRSPCHIAPLKKVYLASINGVPSILQKKINGGMTNDLLLSRLDILKQLQDIQSSESHDFIQKAKIQWAVEGDENSKFFHGIINRKRANLAIKGVMVDGVWVDDPVCVKEEFCSHFANRFRAPVNHHCKLNFIFPNRLSPDQVGDLERPVTKDEVRTAVWGCGENKSPGPDGYTFEFFRNFWDIIGSDLFEAVEWFFVHCSFTRGCNSSFVALIPKTHDPKFVSDYRPISLIGSLYKVITKILANRLSFVISDLISDVQTAFLPNRQILDGPFIINELLSWCKSKKQQAMVFKVDFAKAYDSIRWDYLDEVLRASGFEVLNGRIMDWWQPTFRTVDEGIFTGIKIDSSLNISHLFYADDAVFIGEWSTANISGITHILHCFSLLSGLTINIRKSHLLGVGLPDDRVAAAASNLGCSVMKTPFKYLGVMVGGNTSKIQAWDEVIGKLKARLSKWKLKTLSVGGSFLFEMRC